MIRKGEIVKQQGKPYRVLAVVPIDPEKFPNMAKRASHKVYLQQGGKGTRLYAAYVRPNGSILRVYPEPGKVSDLPKHLARSPYAKAAVLQTAKVRGVPRTKRPRHQIPGTAMIVNPKQYIPHLNTLYFKDTVAIGKAIDRGDSGKAKRLTSQAIRKSVKLQTLLKQASAFTGTGSNMKSAYKAVSAVTQALTYLYREMSGRAPGNKRDMQASLSLASNKMQSAIYHLEQEIRRGKSVLQAAKAMGVPVKGKDKLHTIAVTLAHVHKRVHYWTSPTSPQAVFKPERRQLVDMLKRVTGMLVTETRKNPQLRDAYFASKKAGMILEANRVPEYQQRAATRELRKAIGFVAAVRRQG